MRVLRSDLPGLRWRGGEGGHRARRCSPQPWSWALAAPRCTTTGRPGAGGGGSRATGGRAPAPGQRGCGNRRGLCCPGLAPRAPRRAPALSGKMSGAIFAPLEGSGALDAASGHPLVCPLCHVQYERPCLLDCFHDFCAGCLRGRAADGRLACPLCQ